MTDTSAADAPVDEIGDPIDDDMKPDTAPVRDTGEPKGPDDPIVDGAVPDEEAGLNADDATGAASGCACSTAARSNDPSLGGLSLLVAAFALAAARRTQSAAATTHSGQLRRSPSVRHCSPSPHLRGTPQPAQ